MSLPAEAVRDCFHALFLYAKRLFALAPIHSVLKLKNAEKEDRKTHAKRVTEKRNVWSTAGEKQILLNCSELEVADSPIFFDILRAAPRKYQLHVEIVKK